MNETILTVRQVAERYGVTRPTIHTLIRQGQFPTGFCVGRLRRWRASDLDSWEQEQSRKGGKE